MLLLCPKARAVGALAAGGMLAFGKLATRSMSTGAAPDRPLIDGGQLQNTSP